MIQEDERTDPALRLRIATCTSRPVRLAGLQIGGVLPRTSVEQTARRGESGIRQENALDCPGPD